MILQNHIDLSGNLASIAMVCIQDFLHCRLDPGYIFKGPCWESLLPWLGCMHILWGHKILGLGPAGNLSQIPEFCA